MSEMRKIIIFLFLTIILINLFSMGQAQAVKESEMMGHDDKKSMQKMDKHEPEKHWTAPEEAVKQSNPIPADKASIERGRSLYKTNCAICHGESGQGDGQAGAALTPKPANLAAMAGLHPDGDFAWKISTGRGAMPAWKGILTENQIWDVVNFIQSLAPKGKKEMPMHDKKDTH